MFKISITLICGERTALVKFLHQKIKVYVFILKKNNTCMLQMNSDLRFESTNSLELPSKLASSFEYLMYSVECFPI